MPGDACWSNNVKLTNGDGDWVGPSYNVSYQSAVHALGPHLPPVDDGH